jgi:hypothetical protein
MPTPVRPFVLLALGAILIGLVWWTLSTTSPPAPPSAPGPSSQDAPAAATVALGGPSIANTIEAPASTREPAAVAPPTKPTSTTWHGAVVDSRGQPLALVPIGLAPFDQNERRLRLPEGAQVVHSDSLGTFAITAGDRTMAPVAGDGWCTLRTTSAEPGSTGELLVIAARAVALDGRISRPDGTPLPGATVQPMVFFLTEFPRPLEQTFMPDPDHATSDERGDYRLPAVPVAAGLDLLFSCQGYAPKRLPSEQAASGRLDVTLTPSGGRTGRLQGRVQDAQGPVAGAQVLLGHDQEAETDARGEFTFEIPARPTRLLVTARGYQPLVREGIGADTKTLTIELTARALRIEGHVRRSDGSPAVGWRLDLVDPVRGRQWRPAEGECSDTGGGIEGALAVTDGEGRFVVGGLSDRTYRLLAYDPASLCTLQSEPIAAGTTGVVLTVPADALLDELRGQVVDRRGVPVVGAGLLCYLSPASAQGIASGPSTETDAEGRFVLRRVPRGFVQLGVSGEGLVYVTKPIEDWLRERDLRIVVQRTCHVQIEGEAGLVVTFLDGDGKRLMVTSQTQGAMFGGDGWNLRGGKSPVLSLPETTATMVWQRNGKELGRKAVYLDSTPGAVTLVIAAP